MSLKSKWQAHSFVHFCWIIFILILSNVYFISVKLGPNESVKDILNFAISFSSLVLAIFAIGQSLISSGALPDAVASVREGIADVRSAAEKLSQSASTIDKHSQVIDSRTSSINEGLSRLGELYSENTGQKNNDRTLPDVEFSEKLLLTASPVFLAGLYVAALSYQRKKIYITLKLTGDWPSSLNIIGILTAMTGLGLITTSENPHADSRYVTSLGKFDWVVEKQENIISTIKALSPDYYSETFHKVVRYFEH